MMMMTMMLMMMLMMMRMMMMKMTQMKLVNSGTKFRPGMDKFSQPNSGGPQFQKRGRGYIYICIYIYMSTQRGREAYGISLGESQITF